MTDMVGNEIFGVWHTSVAEALDYWLRRGSGEWGSRISVYHSVLSTFVTPGDASAPDLEVKPTRLDNLLCEGDAVLLAIFEGDASETQESACRALGLAYTAISEDDEDLGQEYINSYMNSFLDQMKDQDRGELPRYAARILHRVPEDKDKWEYADEGQWVYDRTKEMRMFVQLDNGVIPWYCFTWYGAEMGLAGAMLPGRRHLEHVCAEAAWDRMWKTLEGPQEPGEEGKLPLRKRLDRVSRGEKSPQLMRRMVQDFGAISLGQWMAGDPDGLEKLTDAGLTPGNSYREAATRIYGMLWDEKRESSGRELMMALCKPHAEENQAGTLRKSGSGSLCHETLACILKGAVLANGQDYFEWRLNEICTEWLVEPSYPYGTAVRVARDRIQKLPDDDCLDLYYQLLIYLTIEPFASNDSYRCRNEHQNKEDKNNEL